MNTMKYKSLVTIACIGFASMAIADKEQGEPTSEPPIPSAIADAGVAYHTLTGREAQVTFTSRTPLENIVGKSNVVVGYIVKGPEGSPASLVGARWLLPVESLATGIPLRDEHLAHEWLDANTYPRSVLR